LTPWWLRPTAEGANEEKDDKRDKPHEKAAPAPPVPPAAEPQTSVAPESVSLTSPSLKEASPSLEAEPDWRHEPVPEFEAATRQAAYEPEPVQEEESPRYYSRTEALPSETYELPSIEEEDDEDEDEDDELSAGVLSTSDIADTVESAETAEGAEGTTEALDEAARESRRRRPRRSRGRRKEGRAAAPGTSPSPGDTEEDEEPVREEPAYEEPAPRRVAAPAPAPSLRSRDSFVVPANELETFSREIVITVPERQRVADERKIAMFCDLENIALGVRDSEVGKFDIELILERLLEKGKIIVKKAYADWERYSEYKRPFHESAIELIDIPQKYYSGKNSADIKMVVDAMDLSYSKEHLDTFVILSGDSDFSPLVSKLKENNKYVIGVGVKNSSSALLIDNCDEFLYYEDVWRDTQKGPKLDGLNKKTAEAFSLMIDAIQALLRENKDVLWGSMIKQTMQRKKPSFNEGYYGYPSFSELLEDAERKNIIRLKKDQRSGTYVVTGFAKGNEAPVSIGRR
jgi:uncharacterized protein (TIGR00288 family)